jgi:hypothetical protein
MNGQFQQFDPVKRMTASGATFSLALVVAKAR